MTALDRGEALVASSDAAATSQPEISQAEISAEMAELAQAYERERAALGPRVLPRLDYPPYRSSLLRHPLQASQLVDPEGAELVAPVFGPRDVDPLDADLTIRHAGQPLGERLVVTGRVTNAAGRYIHQRDQHPAPLDPNFTGMGRCLTDGDGVYRFTTIKPGPYPWRNHRNAWRPAHIHFSLFGTDFTQRLVTQMYFPGDPLFPLDPIYQAIPDQAARDRLVAGYDHDVTQHEWATGYRWDIVLTGSHATPLEPQETP